MADYDIIFLRRVLFIKTVIFTLQVQVDPPERAPGLRARLSLAEDEGRGVPGQTRGRFLSQQRRKVSKDAEARQDRRLRRTGQALRVPTKGDGRRAEKQAGQERRNLESGR